MLGDGAEWGEAEAMGASCDFVTVELPSMGWDCVMEESNEKCLRRAGEDRDEGEAAEREGGVRVTETGVADVGVDGEWSTFEMAVAAAAAAEMDAAGTSERLCVSMLYT